MRFLSLFLYLSGFLASDRALSEEGMYSPGILASNFNQTEVGKAVWQIRYNEVSNGRTFSNYGSLVFIDPYGTFITNFHVMEAAIKQHKSEIDLSRGYHYEAGPLITHLPNGIISNSVTGERLSTKVLWMLGISPQIPIAANDRNPNKRINTSQDFVVGRIYGRNFHALSVAQEAPKIGDRVFAAGYPLEPFNLLSQNGIAGNYPDADGTLRISTGTVESVPENAAFLNGKVITSTTHIAPGSSGGPLLNSRGELVGIVTFREAGDFFILKTNYRKNLVHSVAIPTIVNEFRKYRDILPPSCSSILGSLSPPQPPSSRSAYRPK